jgi:hypothetical protein
MALVLADTAEKVYRHPKLTHAVPSPLNKVSTGREQGLIDRNFPWVLTENEASIPQ